MATERAMTHAEAIELLDRAVRQLREGGHNVVAAITSYYEGGFGLDGLLRHSHAASAVQPAMPRQAVLSDLVWAVAHEVTR